MQRILLIFLVSALPLAGFEPPPEPGPVVAPGEGDAAWRPLFSSLAGQGQVWSAFVERRWFAFRKKPVVLKGEMRFSPARGLSLQYLEPSVRTVIADEKGLAMRDARGRTREIPPDARATGPTGALLPILRFDLRTLEERFEVHGTRDGTGWRLDFVSRDPGLARLLGTVIVSGEGARVLQIEFRHSAKERVEIRITEARTGVEFTPEEERRFFR